MPRAKIYYLTPACTRPSWGVGMIYYHVACLRRNGYDAFVLHEEAPFKLEWFDHEAPVIYLNQIEKQIEKQIQKEDYLVVPELMADDPRVLALPCRKAVHVQNIFFMAAAAGTAPDYTKLGYERAMVQLPHIQKTIQRFHGIEGDLVPPFVAPYFYMDTQSGHRTPRRKRVVIYPKSDSLDYQILFKVISGHAAANSWEILELRGKRHSEVSDIFKDSAFFVSVNCHEAFNTSVPEAMAAGCIPFCFEAYGGKDFLRDGRNACVFPNNHIYPLLERLTEWMSHYGHIQPRLVSMRKKAFQTADGYRLKKTEVAVLDFFQKKWKAPKTLEIVS